MKCCFRDIISSLSSLFAKVPTTSIQNEKFRVISVSHEQPDLIKKYTVKVDKILHTAIFFFDFLGKYAKEKLGFSAIFILETGEHVLWQTVKTQMKCHKFLIFSGSALHTKTHYSDTKEHHFIAGPSL